MTRSKTIYVERPNEPKVAPNTVALYGKDRQLYMKDDQQTETLMMSAPSNVDFVVMESNVEDILDDTTHLTHHIDARGRAYPTLVAGATIVSANADWTLGTVAEVIPASAITSAYHIHAVSIESCNRDAVFELAIYQGAGDTEISRVRFAISGGFFGNIQIPITCEEIEANARIRAALASSNGTAQIATITMSVIYHIEA